MRAHLVVGAFVCLSLLWGSQLASGSIRIDAELRDSLSLHHPLAAGSYYSGNGHSYVYVPYDKPSTIHTYLATAANYGTTSRSHLATITTQGEFDFIFSTMGVRMAYLAASDWVQEGKFVWLDGPEVGQTVITSNFWWMSYIDVLDGTNDDCLAIGLYGDCIDVRCHNPSTNQNGFTEAFGYLVEISEENASMLMLIGQFLGACRVVYH